MKHSRPLTKREIVTAMRELRDAYANFGKAMTRASENGDFRESTNPDYVVNARRRLKDAQASANFIIDNS